MMRILGTTLLILSSAIPLHSAERSGHAEAELLKASDTYQAGKPVLLGIRMKMDDGWHSYWENPGEGGMALSVDWELPEGWKAGPVQYPVPKRFLTGELPGFGYEGEVIHPVVIQTSAALTGEVEIKAAISWLTCNDEACVAGDVTLTTTLKPGEPEPTKDAERIKSWLAKVPAAQKGYRLHADGTEDEVKISIDAPEGADLSQVDVYPATTDAVDHYKAITLSASKDGSWKGTVGVHEYADGPPDSLELVLAGKGIKNPVRVAWEKDSPVSK